MSGATAAIARAQRRHLGGHGEPGQPVVVVAEEQPARPHRGDLAGDELGERALDRLAVDVAAPAAARIATSGRTPSRIPDQWPDVSW